MPIPKPISDQYDYPHDGGNLQEDYQRDQARFKEVTDEELKFQREKVLKEAGWKHDILWTHSMVAGEHNFLAAEMWQGNIEKAEKRVKRSKPYIDDDTAEPEGAPE